MFSLNMVAPAQTGMFSLDHHGVSNATCYGCGFDFGLGYDCDCDCKARSRHPGDPSVKRKL